MLNLFNRNKQLLDEDIIEWIFNCYAWTFEQFDKNVFLKESILVIPDNSHFPGSETSADGMANLIFNQVKQYAGMAHWPTQLFNLGNPDCQIPDNRPVQINGALINGALRGKNALTHSSQSAFPQSSMPQSAMPLSTMPQIEKTNKSIAFTYHPQQLKSPEGLIAHFAHGLSYQLAITSTAPPPGGPDYLPMAGELTGIFMGFGIMFVNSAAAKRSGGCCGVQGPVRQVFLSEEEATYALAVFCHLKGIERSLPVKHLKKHLRGFFKDSLKDCEQRMNNNSHLKLAFSASK